MINKKMVLCVCGCVFFASISWWYIQYLWKQPDITNTNILPISVVATTAVIGDMVASIGGDNVKVKILIPSGLDPHSYELVKQNIDNVYESSILFKNGLGLEHSGSLQSVFSTHPNVVDLGGLIMSEARYKMIFVSDLIDPHIWLDMEIWSVGADIVSKELSTICPEHAAEFTYNAQKFKERCLEVHNQVIELFNEWRKERHKFVCAHMGLNYFVKAYMMDDSYDNSLSDMYAAPEGFAPDKEVSIEDIKRVANFILENNLMVVFPEYGINKSVLEKIINVLYVSEGLSVKMAPDELWTDSVPDNKSADRLNVADIVLHNARVLLQEYSSNHSDI